ncbi:UNVERIFIED_CONTAM: hypothetical protein Sangu_2904300 [Sesamum angustifolium]|uniref:Retrotransposon gag domain-containing protein n=1 Tax=Sesamum angustifolium TaxID=2727405 RepID=A0AAW2IM29_9LAMI
MPIGYQPPVLRQFDGKGNPRQHIAHFIETCNNPGTDGDLLVKQFVRSVKGNAFDWYIDLKPESIDEWDEMKKKFLSRFYNTHQMMSMVELTNTKQRKDKPGIKPSNIDELATLAHDMELNIVNHKPKFPVGHQKKESLKDKYFNKVAAIESMIIKENPIKFPPNKISEKLQITKAGLL